MKAEIIMIGTELLLGQIVDTNAAYLAKQLAETGFNLYHKTTVGDNDVRITESIRNALQRSDVVITSGGLGPTVDDKTREAVASATGRQLFLDQELLKEVADFFRKSGLYNSGVLPYKYVKENRLYLPQFNQDDFVQFSNKVDLE